MPLEWTIAIIALPIILFVLTFVALALTRFLSARMIEGTPLILPLGLSFAVLGFLQMQNSEPYEEIIMLVIAHAIAGYWEWRHRKRLDAEEAVNDPS